jgi:hypothetical protein
MIRSSLSGLARQSITLLLEAAQGASSCGRVVRPVLGQTTTVQAATSGLPDTLDSVSCLIWTFPKSQNY